jgi:hypothetical protein
MLGRGCKLRCTRCGYFEDCSDTGLPAYGPAGVAVRAALEEFAPRSSPRDPGGLRAE